MLADHYHIYIMLRVYRNHTSLQVRGCSYRLYFLSVLTNLLEELLLHVKFDGE